MDVCYSSSNEFSVHTCISILSLLDNNTNVENIHIYLFDLGINEDNKRKIQSVVDKYHRGITFLSIDNEKIKNFLSDKIPTHYGSYATYARLCATILFPQYVHRILYVDSDMIITDTLETIYNVDMVNEIVACVPQKRDFFHMGSISLEEVEIMKNNELYMNAGLLLINIDNWIKQDFSETIKQTLLTMHDFENKDQSILNKALQIDQIYRLPFKYNYTMHRYPQYLLKMWARKASPLTYEEIMDAAKNPIVIHYCGDQSRPWYKENTSCLASEYYKYKSMSPYADVPLESIFDSSKYTGASKVSKAFMAIYYRTHQKVYGFPFFCINQLRINFNCWRKRRNMN